MRGGREIYRILVSSLVLYSICSFQGTEAEQFLKRGGRGSNKATKVNF